MRIVIDLQSCQSGSRKGGIGRYSSELARAMLREGRGHEFWIVLNAAHSEAEREVRYSFSNLVPQDRILSFHSLLDVKYFNNNKAKVRVSELIREDFLRSIKADFIHVSSLFEGLNEDVVTSVNHTNLEARTAVTLYDLIPLVQREQYLSHKEALSHYLGKVDELKKADVLLAISEYSRAEAIELLGVSPVNVVNISSAADRRFCPTEISSDHANALQTKYGITRKYIMYTGSFDQRKNQSRLIEAFSKIPSQIRRNYQLVIVGNGWPEIYNELKLHGKKVGLNEHDLIFAGHVPDEDLLPLYNLCHLFVFPSLAEGFGLPVLEAMACGVPTIGSDCTSIPEVLGWADAQFDPRNVEGISKKMHQALTDAHFYAALKEHGLKQSKKFSWEKSAKIALDAFEQTDRVKRKKQVISNSHRDTLAINYGESFETVTGVISKTNGICTFPDIAIADIAQAIALNHAKFDIPLLIREFGPVRPKIGWVTTWNVKCGIASYSEYLLKNFPYAVDVLAAYSNYTVERDGPNVQRCWQINSAEGLGALYTAVIERKINIVVIQFNYGFFDFAALKYFLNALHDKNIKIYITFHSTSDPAESKKLSLIREEIEKCEGLLVHSEKDIIRLKSLSLNNNIIFFPQGCIAYEKHPPKEGGSNSPIILATYGFALPGKGLEEVVQAVSILRKQGRNVHLLMINSRYPEGLSDRLIERLGTLIMEYGLSEYVTTIHDYLEEGASIEHLSSAALILYCYQKTGESSSAAVRMGLAAKVPVAVTPLEIFSDVKESVFLLPGFDPESIALGINEVLFNQESENTKKEEIIRNASCWTTAHAYNSLSIYLLRLLLERKPLQLSYELPPDFEINQNSSFQVWSLEDPQWGTQVGYRESGTIKTGGREGYVLFGPFVSIGPGFYKIGIYGCSKSVNYDGAYVEVAINSGANILGRSYLSPLNDDQIEGCVKFEVPKNGARDMEVRVWALSRHDFELSTVRVSPI